MTADVHDYLDELLKRAETNDAALAKVLASDYADEAMAQRFSARHGEDLAYVAAWGRWLRWDGRRWSIDETLAAFDLVRDLAREIAADLRSQVVKKDRIAAKILDAKSIAAVEKLAKADRRHARGAGDWDCDPWLLNTLDGVLNLGDGQLRQHRRADLMTKITAVGVAAETPKRWLAFLDRIFASDREMIAFLQRVLGSSLLGVIREHALFFFHGPGANGKSVLLNVLRRILADYAAVLPGDVLVATKYEKHPTDLAMLRGARVAIAHETERNQRWAEARIKTMSAGDPMTARFMRRDNFTFEPQFTLLVAGNHLPSMLHVDAAIRRRLHIIPFSVSIPPAEQDVELADKLFQEGAGILAWMVGGCAEYLERGLAPPPAVNATTAEYLVSQDVLGRFLEERCESAGPDDFEEVQDLFHTWTEWCDGKGEAVGTEKGFSQKLQERGFRRGKNPRNRRSVIFKIRLADNSAKGSKGSSE